MPVILTPIIAPQKSMNSKFSVFNSEGTRAVKKSMAIEKINIEGNCKKENIKTIKNVYEWNEKGK